MSEDNMTNPLQAVSNVIELKPDRKYLLIFRGANRQVLDRVAEGLRHMGIENLTISIPDGSDIEVIEMSAQEQGAC